MKLASVVKAEKTSVQNLSKIQDFVGDHQLQDIDKAVPETTKVLN